MFCGMFVLGDTDPPGSPIAVPFLLWSFSSSIIRTTEFLRAVTYMVLFNGPLKQVTLIYPVDTTQGSILQDPLKEVRDQT